MTCAIIHTDASVKKSKMRGGGTIRSVEGDRTHSFHVPKLAADNTLTHSVQLAEACAIEEGLRRAMSEGYTKFCVFSGAKHVVKPLMKYVKITGSIIPKRYIPKSLVKLVRQYNVKLFWIPREFNKEADTLSRKFIAV